MSKRSSQDIERFHFERFRNVYALPDGHIEYGDKPDIILTTGARTIGIEATRFYLLNGSAPESEQRQTPMRQWVVRSAEDIYRATGGNIELAFSFDPAVPITPARCKLLPRELANVAKCADADAPDKSGLIYPSPKIPELANIHFNGEWPDPHWRIFQVSDHPKMSPVALEGIVREKERKAAHYRICDSYWLFVIVDWTDRGQDQEIRLGKPNITSDIFEKVIVYKWGFDHIVELTCSINKPA